MEAKGKGGRGPTKEQLQELVGRTLTDQEFRKGFYESPQRAAAELGIEFTPKQLEVMEKARPEIAKAVEALEKQEALALGPGVLIPIADVAIVSAFA